MWLELLIRGIIIGLTASIPLGPIGVLCIQRTLSKNHKSGFVSGLGSATADLVFASVALFSLTVVLSFIESHLMLIKAIGGACVIGVGAHIFFTNPVVQIRRNRAGKTNLWQDYISLFFITIANPAFILIFVALFAAFGFSAADLGFAKAQLLVAGVFLGASLWWFMLTFSVNLLRKRFRPRHLLWMNRISGSVIVALGIAT
ncbi:MAG: LysE family translocator, partial [Rikenellaceae bacterium]|nr:LysE family translocator [Rikenellaceae bacterium]